MNHLTVLQGYFIIQEKASSVFDGLQQSWKKPFIFAKKTPNTVFNGIWSITVSLNEEIYLWQKMNHKQTNKHTHNSTHHTML